MKRGASCRAFASPGAKSNSAQQSVHFSFGYCRRSGRLLHSLRQCASLPASNAQKQLGQPAEDLPYKLGEIKQTAQKQMREKQQHHLSPFTCDTHSTRNTAPRTGRRITLYTKPPVSTGGLLGTQLTDVASRVKGKAPKTSRQGIIPQWGTTSGRPGSNANRDPADG